MSLLCANSQISNFCCSFHHCDSILLHGGLHIDVNCIWTEFTLWSVLWSRPITLRQTHRSNRTNPTGSW